MHILAGIVALLLAAGFWWYRLRQAHQAGREASAAVTATARRLRASQQAHLGSVSPLLSVEDPVTMAATLILSIVCEGRPVPPGVERRLAQALHTVADEQAVTEAIAQGKRLQRKTTRVMEVVQLLGSRLAERLTIAERIRLVEMVQDVFAANPSRPAHTANRIVALRGVLELSEAG